MADVNAPAATDGDDAGGENSLRDGGSRLRDGEGFRDADRGQLLLVAGLVMAVSLVALVVLLNASIYSENLATRGVEAADGEPLELRAAAVDGTGTLIDATNRDRPGSYADAANAVEAGIDDLDGRLARTAAERGGISHLNLTGDGVRQGRYVAGPVDDSGVVRDAERTRAFVLDMDASSLPPANASTAPGTAVTVVFNRTGSNTTHEAYVYEPTDGSADAAIATATNGTDATETCRLDAVGGSRVPVGLTAGTIDGEPCPGIWPTELRGDADPYDIEFANTGGVDAEMTATALTSTDPDGPLADGSDPAVYDATLRFRYRTADVRVETTVRVAPGEPNA
ncbi:hypothetical protein [Halorubrum sp. BV1]|uniref:DUF7261 family protein n=1 Tax=Halorubrum sp. BV1 TaxID=1498500 RepID=UPI000A9F17B1|nr:hypothetical protein [Halorubrum sp. BV1]